MVTPIWPHGSESNRALPRSHKTPVVAVFGTAGLLALLLSAGVGGNARTPLGVVSFGENLIMALMGAVMLLRCVSNPGQQDIAQNRLGLQIRHADRAKGQPIFKAHLNAAEQPSRRLADGLFIGWKILAGHPFLSHREGTAAIELFGTLFCCRLGGEHVNGLSLNRCDGTAADQQGKSEAEVKLERK